MTVTGDKRLHVSVSELRAMQTCGQRWYYEYELGRKAPGTPALIRGRAVHEQARLNWRRKREGEVPLSADEAKALTADIFSRTVDADGVRFTDKERHTGQKEALGAEKDAAVEFAAVHAAQVVPFIEPAEVEVEVATEPLEDLNGKSLLGRIDLVSKPRGGAEACRAPFAVRDLKTAARKSPEREIHGDQQLSVYALLWSWAHPEEKARPLLVKDTIVRPPSGREAYVFSQFTSRTEEELKGVVESLARVERIRMAGIVPPPAPPNSWVCSQRWCSHTSYCPFYQRRADPHAT